jgi:hypothetical protein
VGSIDAVVKKQIHLQIIDKVPFAILVGLVTLLSFWDCCNTVLLDLLEEPSIPQP